MVEPFLDLAQIDQIQTQIKETWLNRFLDLAQIDQIQTQIKQTWLNRF